MPSRVDELFFDLTARTAGLVGPVGAAQRRMKGFSRFMTGPGGPIVALAAFGVAAVAAGIKATKMAGELDKSLREVATLLPGTVEDLEGVRRSIIRLSTEVPEPPAQLTRALYQTISAGITDTAEAFGVLEVASRAAVAGLSDTFSAVDAITTVLNAYQLSTDQATRVSDVFFTTIKEGKLVFGDIAANIGTVATSAALAGVSIEEVGAALATMTKFGINAAEASTALNRFLLSVTQATDDQIAAAKRLGIEWNTTALRSKGLVGFLQDLNIATKGNIDLLAEINPNIRAARAAFILAGEGAAEYARILNSTNNAAGATQDAFEDMRGALDTQAQLLKNKVNAAWLELGSKLLPDVIALLEQLNELIGNETLNNIRLLEKLGREEEALALRRKLWLEDSLGGLQANRDLIDSNIDRIIALGQEFERFGSQGPQPLLEQMGNVLRGFSKEAQALIAPLVIPIDAGDLATTQEDANQRAEEALRLYDEIADLSDHQRSILLKIAGLWKTIAGQAEKARDAESSLFDNLTEEEDAQLKRLRTRVQLLERAGGENTKELKNAQKLVDLRENELVILEQRAQLSEVLGAAFAGAVEIEIGGAATGPIKSAEEARERIQRIIAATIEDERELTKEEERQVDVLEDIEDRFIAVTTLEKARLQIGEDVKRNLEEQKEELDGLIDALSELRDLGINFTEAFDDPALEAARQGLLTGVREDERNIDSLTESLKELIKQIREARQAQRQAQEGTLFDEMFPDQKEVQLKTRSITSLVATLRQWTNAAKETGLTINEVTDFLEEHGRTIDELRRAGYGELADELDTLPLEGTEKGFEEIAAEIGFAARAAVELAGALGLVEESAIRVVNQVVLIGEGISRIAAGDILGGVSGIISGVAGLVSTIFGGGETPEERQRREAIEKNSRAIENLTKATNALAALRDIRSTDVPLLTGAARTLGTPESQALLRKRELAVGFGDILEEEVFKQLGLDLDELTEAAKRFGVDLDVTKLGIVEFAREIILLGREIRELDLDILRSTFEGAQSFADLRNQVFDVEGLGPEFEAFFEGVLAGVPGFADLADMKNFVAHWKNLMPDLFASFPDIEKLTGDIEDPEVAAAWEALSRFLVDNFDMLFKAGFFGTMTPEQAMEFVRAIDRFTDRAQELGEDGISDSQNVSAINRATSEQGDVLVGLLGTGNFWLEEIHERLVELRDGGLPTEAEMAGAAAAGGGSFELNVTQYIEGFRDPTEVANDSALQIERLMDRVLGNRLIDEVRGTGLAPRRNL